MACEGCCDRRQLQFCNVMLLRGQGLLWLSKGCTVAGPSATQKANSCLSNLSSWPIALPRTRLAVSLPPRPWCSRAVVVLSGCNKFKTYQTSLPLRSVTARTECTKHTLRSQCPTQSAVTDYRIIARFIASQLYTCGKHYIDWLVATGPDRIRREMKTNQTRNIEWHVTHMTTSLGGCSFHRFSHKGHKRKCRDPLHVFSFLSQSLFVPLRLQYNQYRHVSLAYVS